MLGASEAEGSKDWLGADEGTEVRGKIQGTGSTRSLVDAVKPLGTNSKCKSESLADPLIPDKPITSPALTILPCETLNGDARKPYNVEAESELWRRTT